MCLILFVSFARYHKRGSEKRVYHKHLREMARESVPPAADADLESAPARKWPATFGGEPRLSMMYTRPDVRDILRVRKSFSGWLFAQ